MTLSMQSQASVESGENKLICPHYEKKKTLRPPAPARLLLSQMSGIRNEAVTASWDFLLQERRHMQSNKAASSAVTVYLLTGPMLLGIPAREKQREREGLFSARSQVASSRSAVLA